MNVESLYDEMTALTLAVINGNRSIVDALLTHPSINTSWRSASGMENYWYYKTSIWLRDVKGHALTQPFMV